MLADVGLLRITFLTPETRRSVFLSGDDSVMIMTLPSNTFREEAPSLRNSFSYPFRYPVFDLFPGIRDFPFAFQSWFVASTGLPFLFTGRFSPYPCQTQRANVSPPFSCKVGRCSLSVSSSLPPRASSVRLFFLWYL